MSKNNYRSIVLITVDSLRNDYINKETTPNICRMEENGIRFTQAFSDGPNIFFSFPSLFTSTYPLTYREKRETGAVSLKANKTMAEILKEKGFNTVGIHSNPYISELYGYDRGFDRFLDLGESSTQATPDKQRIVLKIFNKLCENSGKFCLLRAWLRKNLYSKIHMDVPYARAGEKNREGN